LTIVHFCIAATQRQI